MQPKKEYNQSIDILRIISILAVILIHTTTKTIETTGLDVKAMPWALFLNQIARFAVPLFFMISGFVLQLNYPNHASYLTYLKKRFNKILWPYVFWSLIYLLFVYSQPIKNFISVLLLGEASYQLYFIPTLLIFYLAFPFLHWAYKVVANKWVLLILGMVEMGLLYQDYYVKQLPFSHPINIALLNFLPFLLGMWACHHQQKILSMAEKWKYLLGVITAGLGIFVFWQGRERYLMTHNYLAFYSQWRPSVMIYSIMLGIVLFWSLNKIKRNYWFVKKLSRLSFLVFFIHVIWIEIIWHRFLLPVFMLINKNIFGEILFEPIFFGIITIFSFGAAWLIQKIPLIKKIAG